MAIISAIFHCLISYLAGGRVLLYLPTSKRRLFVTGSLYPQEPKDSNWRNVDRDNTGHRLNDLSVSGTVFDNRVLMTFYPVA